MVVLHWASVTSTPCLFPFCIQMYMCNSVIWTVERECTAQQKFKEKNTCVNVHRMALYTTQRTHIIWYSNESSSTNNENRKVCERVCERDRYFIITCFDDDCMLNEWLTDWLTDWFVNCATFRHANNLQRQTTHDHKIFISPIFVFNLWAFVCERISARLFALNTYFRFHWNAKKNIVFLAKRAIYDNDMCEIFGFICASMLFRCGRRTHAHTHTERENGLNVKM